MTLKITKAWFEAKALLEGDTDIAAGALALHPSLDQAIGEPTREVRLALGPLVRLMRRKHRMTVEKLAEEAQVDLVEIISIEQNASFRPEPRTVFQLASVFGLPNRSLLQLSGNVEVRDERFRTEAVRFAARSESVAQLTSEERVALEEFVAFLSMKN